MASGLLVAFIWWAHSQKIGMQNNLKILGTKQDSQNQLRFPRFNKLDYLGSVNFNRKYI